MRSPGLAVSLGLFPRALDRARGEATRRRCAPLTQSAQESRGDSWPVAAAQQATVFLFLRFAPRALSVCLFLISSLTGVLKKEWDLKSVCSVLPKCGYLAPISKPRGVC